METRRKSATGCARFLHWNPPLQRRTIPPTYHSRGFRQPGPEQKKAAWRRRIPSLSRMHRCRRPDYLDVVARLLPRALGGPRIAAGKVENPSFASEKRNRHIPNIRAEARRIDCPIDPASGCLVMRFRSHARWLRAARRLPLRNTISLCVHSGSVPGKTVSRR